VSITTEDIKLLRESTGAGVLDCKKALTEANGDMDTAIELLRKKGLAAAAKKASREANDGLIAAQMSDDGKTAVMVEVNCETDFVARTEDFQKLVDAMVRQMMASPNIDSAETLLAAPFIDDPGKTVQDHLTQVIAKLGENMRIRQAVRFDLQGGGLIDSYIHMGGRVGVLVEVDGGNAGDNKFAELVHDVALQIAAIAPQYVSENDIPAQTIAAEKEVYMAQLANENKPDNIKERIVEGKLKKWYSEVTLLNQEFVKDPDLTIAKLLKNYGDETKVLRFARFERGA
jgi:elongation factor Ts